MAAAGLENLPALPPPAGVDSNFINPPSKAHDIYVLEGIFLTLMLLTVAMRIYVRSKVLKEWGWDDYACFIAATLTADGVVYPFTILFAKLSILLLYLRVFKVNRPLYWAITGGIAFISLYYTSIIAVALSATAKCNGLAQLHNRFCINYGKPVVLLNATVNVLTDVYVLLLPIPCVLGLQLSFKRKLAILAVFAGGIVTCAVSLVRLINFATHYNNPDVLWIQARNSLFTIVEINVTIIITCASCFRPFVVNIKLFHSSFYSSLISRLSGTGTGSRSYGSLSREYLARDSPNSNGKVKNEAYVELNNIQGSMGTSEDGASNASVRANVESGKQKEGRGEFVKTMQQDVERDRGGRFEV